MNAAPLAAAFFGGSLIVAGASCGGAPRPTSEPPSRASSVSPSPGARTATADPECMARPQTPFVLVPQVGFEAPSLSTFQLDVGRNLLYVVTQSEVQVWDAATGEKRASLWGPNDLRVPPSLRPDGGAVAYASGGQAWILELATGALAPVAETEGAVDARWTAHGQRLAVTRGRTVDLIAADGRRLTIPAAPRSADDAFSADGGKLLARDGSVWDTTTGTRLWQIPGDAPSAGARPFGVFSPDGRSLALVAADARRVWLFDAGTGARRWELPIEGAWNGILWSPDGTRIVLGNGEALHVWNAGTKTRIASFPRAQGHVFTFSPDGATLACVRERTAKDPREEIVLASAATGRLIRTLDGEDGKIMQLHWTSDGASLLVVTFDGVRLVEPGTGRRRMIAFAAGPGASRIVDTAWSPDGSALALASSHSIPAGFASDARVLDLRTGTFRGTLEVINSDDALGQGREVQFENVEWSPDGKLLALIRSNDVVLWDGSSSQPARVLDEDAPDRGTPRAVAFSPDAGVLATTVWLKSEVRFWDPHTGARLFTVPFRAESPVSVAFSPDGTQLAVGTRGREPGLVLLDARTGAVFQTPTGIHEPSAPERLFWGPQGLKIASTQLSAMSPDGNVIADGPDGIRFADTRSGGILKEIPGEGSSIRSLRFSSEGGLLAIARGDRIDLYRVADGATVHVRLIEGPDATAVWVAYTDNGLFAGDPAAFRLLRFRRGSILQPGPLVRADEAGALFRAGLAADLVRGCPLGGE